MPTYLITDVGPRDGLQNEPTLIDATKKARLIQLLYAAGVSRVEIGSFVSEKWVPAMANSAQVIEKLSSDIQQKSMVLVPNEQGFNKVAHTNIRTLAIFTAASETFSQKNTNGSINEIQQRLAPVIKAAKEKGMFIRGYISCVFGCPYEGPIKIDAIDAAISFFLSRACDEIVLSDTIGIATPNDVQETLKHTSALLPANKTALHFHDTYGQALANILRSLDFDITKFDSSIGGLGGCPYANGASGNIATEDLIYLLDGLGLDTGINLEKLLKASRYIKEDINLPIKSKVALALLANN